MDFSLIQAPAPGTNVLRYVGDFIRITLILPEKVKGTAYLRTNLFHPEKKREEIISRAEQNIPRKFQEWGDFPMYSSDERTYSVELPLSTVGYFEAKTFFMPEGTNEPFWPQGKNLNIKVEPAESIIGNSIYCAFVRLFIDNKKLTNIQSNIQQTALEHKNLNIIPETGKFRNLIHKLNFIINELGFDNIMLLPIHPVPTTYARMGMLGSPYAVLDFFNVDPALAEFDKETTPLYQFSELIDAIHARHARIFIDIPINHTGWASQLQIHHPEFFKKNKEGKFISPGAWGVTWSDLSELDYSKTELWHYIADIFLFWCQKGVDGFRCDAGYMIPSEAWNYIIAKVRQEYPSAIFLLEGLGGKVETTKKLITKCNLNWAYSEMFQNYNQDEMDWYLDQYIRLSLDKGPLVNFSETHDNNRLASVSKAFSRLRNGITALLSDTGTFAITCGVEWYATEKIDVHKLTSINWGSPENQIDFIKRLNHILKVHPCFASDTQIKKIHTSYTNSIAYLRSSQNSPDKLAVIANLANTKNTIYLDKEMTEAFKYTSLDLISGKNITLYEESNNIRIDLSPYQIIALSNKEKYLQWLSEKNSHEYSKQIKSERTLKEQLMRLFKHDQISLNETQLDKKIEQFKAAPYNFFYENFETRPPVIKWNYPGDSKREVIIPAHTPLLIRCPSPFHYTLQNQEKTMCSGMGYAIGTNLFVAIINPYELQKEDINFMLHLEVFKKHTVDKVSGPLFLASHKRFFHSKNKYNQSEIKNDPLLASLTTNNISGICLLRGRFANLLSKYDAIISANPNKEVPEDRHIMFTRLRGWTVYRGFSRQISCEYQKTFEHYKNTTEYYFEMPVGGGLHIALMIRFKFHESQNAILIQVKRIKNINLLSPPDEQSVKIIFRPDIESRNHHELTKAFKGPENEWPENIQHGKSGFQFRDGELLLSSEIYEGFFTREDEWQYMVYRSIEAERGMDANGDLYSPGYYSLSLKAGESAEIYAITEHNTAPEHTNFQWFEPKTDIRYLPEVQHIKKILEQSIRAFIVNRNRNKTVIAGYPWFLDWGRDTLICLRGVIAAGSRKEAKSIIREFASLEKEGTLPNIIRAADTSNRDTSDAPLWLFVALADLITDAQDPFLETTCNNRTLKEVLHSIATHYINGTPNGIKMDPQSGLIYSPSHFTWMDTNHPAGTPREGYPIEIQALWLYSIKLLSEIFPSELQWQSLYDQIKSSINTYFALNHSLNENQPGQETFLADCLHTNGFQPAKKAVQDDHLRPNQLFAITFGAINDPELCKGIITACEELIIPGAIRTLADRSVSYKLPIYHQGELLNNPEHPYQGIYTGTEDTSRKPAYHNGTAWTWPFPSYCEALIKTFGKSAHAKASDILSTSMKLLNNGCINQIPEILNGNYPHLQKGCYAQAWGVTEFYRMALKLGLI